MIDKEVKRLVTLTPPMTPKQKEWQRRGFVNCGEWPNNNTATQEMVDHWEAQVLSGVAVFADLMVKEPKECKPLRRCYINADICDETSETPWILKNIDLSLNLLTHVTAKYFKHLSEDNSTSLYDKFLCIVEILEHIAQNFDFVEANRCIGALQWALRINRDWMEKVQWEYAELFSKGGGKHSGLRKSEAGLAGGVNHDD